MAQAQISLGMHPVSSVSAVHYKKALLLSGSVDLSLATMQFYWFAMMPFKSSTGDNSGK